MKKTFGLKRQVPRMTPGELKQLSTKELLLRLERLRWCEKNKDASELTDSEVASATEILFKDTREWQEAYADLRNVLAGRGHVPSAAERRQERAERIKKGK